MFSDLIEAAQAGDWTAGVKILSQIAAFEFETSEPDEGLSREYQAYLIECIAAWQKHGFDPDYAPDVFHTRKPRNRPPESTKEFDIAIVQIYLRNRADGVTHAEAVAATGKSDRTVRRLISNDVIAMPAVLSERGKEHYARMKQAYLAYGTGKKS